MPFAGNFAISNNIMKFIFLEFSKLAILDANELYESSPAETRLTVYRRRPVPQRIQNWGRQQKKMTD